MEQHTLKDVNNCLNTNIYSYFETSDGESQNLYLNVVHFFNTSINQTSVAAQDSCFPALAPNTCCSITVPATIAFSFATTFCQCKCPFNDAESVADAVATCEAVKIKVY